MPLLAIFSVSAETVTIKITYKKKTPTSPIGGSIGRLPMNLPVDVMLDDATGELTTAGPEDLEGCVYVYSVDGIQEGYSPELNATFTLPCIDDIHIISLQGSNWFGEGKVVY